MRYKIVYYTGPELTVKTRMISGILALDSDSLHISGKTNLTVLFSSISGVNLFRLNGLGRMIKIIHRDGTLFLTVVRLNIAGFFVIINFLKAGELCELIKKRIAQIGVAETKS
jgi:hypothetical protein